MTESNQEQEQDNQDNQPANTSISNTQNNNDSGDESSRFKDGQKISLIRVRFPGHAKSYPFLIGKRKLMYGQKVMAMSDRGVAMGYVNSFPYQVGFNKSMLPIKSISKVATNEDVSNEKENYKRQKETETTCQRLIDKHNLAMNLTHVEFTQYGKKVVFYFIASARVDFRGLVKDLVSQLKLRIELRQISVRDRTASMGAVGPCGRELCCSSFLTKYGNVSIKMAKNQNLSINYSKLNGVCGQLKCCLQYEDDVYSQKRNTLPADQSLIETKNGDKGKVFRIHLLNEQFDLLTNKGMIKRFTADQYVKKISPDAANMPNRFQNMSDQTSVIIGLNELQDSKKRQLERDHDKIEIRSKVFAKDVFTELTGIPAADQLMQVAPAKEIKEDKIIKLDANVDTQTVEAKSAPENAPETTPESAADSAPNSPEPVKSDETEKKDSDKKPNNRNRNRNRNRNKKPNPNPKSTDNNKPGNVKED